MYLDISRISVIRADTNFCEEYSFPAQRMIDFEDYRFTPDIPPVLAQTPAEEDRGARGDVMNKTGFRFYRWAIRYVALFVQRKSKTLPRHSFVHKVGHTGRNESTKAISVLIAS